MEKAAAHPYYWKAAAVLNPHGVLRQNTEIYQMVFYDYNRIIPRASVQIGKPKTEIHTKNVDAVLFNDIVR